MDETRGEFAAMRDKLIDAIGDTVHGTDWGPPGEDPMVLAEVVVVMGWTSVEPGHYALSYVRTGSTWSSKGIVREALEQMECADHQHPDADFGGD